jgi:hypothetical protein
MRQAQARKSRTDEYLAVPKRSERPHLRVVDAVTPDVAYVADPGFDEAFAEPKRVVDDLDWAGSFADPSWDDTLGTPPEKDEHGRRTFVVTGRPGQHHMPRRDRTPGSTARMRRQSPTRARLAGRPDRIALWAVALGLIMAAMAGVSGNGSNHSQAAGADRTPAPLLGR